MKRFLHANQLALLICILIALFCAAYFHDKLGRIRFSSPSQAPSLDTVFYFIPVNAEKGRLFPLLPYRVVKYLVIKDELYRAAAIKFEIPYSYQTDYLMVAKSGESIGITEATGRVYVEIFLLNDQIEASKTDLSVTMKKPYGQGYIFLSSEEASNFLNTSPPIRRPTGTYLFLKK